MNGHTPKFHYIEIEVRFRQCNPFYVQHNPLFKCLKMNQLNISYWLIWFSDEDFCSLIGSTMTKQNLATKYLYIQYYF